MNKFKVGDVVIGNDSAKNYNITCKGFVGTVCEVLDDRFMLVSGVNGGESGYLPYTVDMNCFDLYSQVETRSTKQELLDRLSSQGDCYYSLAQVVDMIKSLEDPKPVLYSKVQVTAEGYDSFLDCVRERLEANFSGSGKYDKFVDTDSAEFSINGNCIELDSVDLDSDEVVDTAMECLENVLIQYVEVLEKSDTLEL
jgi:hypothetical protein